MLADIGPGFLAALAKITGEKLGEDHPCAAAARVAAASADPEDLAKLRLRFEALPPADASGILAEVHKALREDVGGILAAWRGASPH